ncbi:MAG TPA: TIGR04211 family SH3 domain-containing protein [Methylococcus sp.]|nr:TIGR04211 family SH3 domain-containing protein [Methylococcus sp.]
MKKTVSCLLAILAAEVLGVSGVAAFETHGTAVQPAAGTVPPLRLALGPNESGQPSSRSRSNPQVVLLRDFNELKQKNNELRQKLAELSENHKALEGELASLRAAKEAAERTAQQASAEKERLSAELAAIRQVSANALQIEAERDQLRKSVINLERELEAKRLQNQALLDDQRQRWFLIGAGVLFGGILLGLFFPQIHWRKRNRWDSF